MNLLAIQRAFRAEIVAADDDGTPSSPGMAIYRNAYRARLLDTLAQGFERTRDWVGAEAFDAAARHYVLTAPPSDWTLDRYGAEFPQLLEQLFAGDGEVAELAWLEWHLQQAFAAPDLPGLDPAALATAGLGEADWAGLHFIMAAGFAARPVRHNCLALWQALRDGAAAGAAPAIIEPAVLVVWRKDQSPHYRLMDVPEFAVLQGLAGALPLGEAAALAGETEGVVARLGQWLAQWLGEGVFSGYSVQAERR